MINFLQEKGGAIYFSICMLVFLFVVYSGNEGNHFIDIPHIEIPTLPLYIVLGVTFFFVILLIPLNKAKFDLLSFLLMIPIFIHFTNSIYMGVSEHFYVHMSTSILSFCVYLITINMNNNIKTLERIFLIFFIVLLTQIFAECILSGSALSGRAEIMYRYKNGIRIPIGASNALAAMISSFFAFLYCSSKKKYKKILLSIITFFIMLMTRSRGGLVDYFVILSILLIWNRPQKNLINAKLAIVPFILLLLLYEFWNSDFGTQFFVKNDSSIVERLELWKSGLQLFENHPLIGNGFHYEALASNPHNVIIEILMRSGLAGLTVFGLILITLFLKLKTNIVNKKLHGGGNRTFGPIFPWTCRNCILFIHTRNHYLDFCWISSKKEQSFMYGEQLCTIP